jgi:hypothetical protein
MVIMVVGASAVGVDAHIVYESIRVVVLVPCNFDQVVPVHYWANEILQFLLLRLLLGFEVLAHFEPFVFDFLTRSLGAIIEKTGALGLAFISTDVALLKSLLLLFADETYV